MARHKSSGKHAANQASYKPEMVEMYSRNHYGSQAHSSRSRKNPWRVVFVVSIIVLIAALIGLGAIAFQYISQQRAYDDLEQYASISDAENVSLADLTVDWDALRAVNPNIVALYSR